MKKKLKGWAVMKLYPFTDIRVGEFQVTIPTDGPHFFIPVFNTKKQAVQWHGSAEHVQRVEGVEE